MNILLCNDDGIYAEGIYALASRLSQNHQVTVVAPYSERSASGHSITINSILRCERVKLPNLDCVAVKVDGTPADCVLFALLEVMETPPDIIISGINNGQNLGTDSLYSGTVSAAMEGAVNGIKSFAVSLCKSPGEEADFEAAAEHTERLINKYKDLDLPFGTMLNINIPSPVSSVAGEVFTRVGISWYNNSYITRQDPYGKNYYSLTGAPIAEKVNDEDTDTEYSKKKYITIVPLNYDLTDHGALDAIKKDLGK